MLQRRHKKEDLWKILSASYILFSDSKSSACEAGRNLPQNYLGGKASMVFEHLFLGLNLFKKEVLF